MRTAIDGDTAFHTDPHATERPSRLAEDGTMEGCQARSSDGGRDDRPSWDAYWHAVDPYGDLFNRKHERKINAKDEIRR